MIAQPTLVKKRILFDRFNVKFDTKSIQTPSFISKRK